MARLFSFHSYRAGLATALHAAGVPDDMIQLICRWMCPESLRRYRVIGLREHEQNVNRAVDVNVDSIQAANVPKVANNEGFALMLSELVHANSRASNQLAKQFDSANSSFPPNAQALRTPSPKTARVRAHPYSHRTDAHPAPAQPPPNLVPASSPLVGDSIVVAHTAWPTWRCAEFGGLGWSAVVKRVSSYACRVTFDVARTRDGRPYADAVVPRSHLLRLS